MVAAGVACPVGEDLRMRLPAPSVSLPVSEVHSSDTGGSVQGWVGDSGQAASTC